MADRSTTAVGWHLRALIRLDGKPSQNQMARNGFWAFPMSKKELIQQAILQVLTPIFDPGFSESSFGFRPNRSAQEAAKQVQAHIRSGFRHCVDMDLSKFFDRVQHDVLLARVSRKVHDKRLLSLIGRYLRAGVMVDAQLQPSLEGTMQGGPLSPILANILLDDFDKELEQRGLRLVRYADDFLVFTKTSEAARRVYDSVGRYLTRKLKLVVNLQKSRILPHGRSRVPRLHLPRLQRPDPRQPEEHPQVQGPRAQITRRNRGVSMSHRYQELRWYFQGWVGYFCLVPTKSFFSEMDKWVRRRLRSCYWKQWRRHTPGSRISGSSVSGSRKPSPMASAAKARG